MFVLFLVSVFFSCLLMVYWNTFTSQFWFIYGIFEYSFLHSFLVAALCDRNRIYHNLLVSTFYLLEWSTEILLLLCLFTLLYSKYNCLKYFLIPLALYQTIFLFLLQTSNVILKLKRYPYLCLSHSFFLPWCSKIFLFVCLKNIFVHSFRVVLLWQIPFS